MCRDRSIALWIFALASAIFCIFMNWTPQEGDAEVGFQATRALARRGELYLSGDTPSAKLILKTLDPEGGAYNCRKGVDGKQYPYWGLAYVAAGVPFYYIGSAFDGVFPNINAQFEKQTFGAEAIGGSEYFARIFVFTLQPLCAAAALAFIYIACRRAAASEFASLASALACGFATHLCVQARSGLSDAQAVFVVSLSVERALAARKSRGVFDYITFGAALGVGLLTKVHTVFAAAPLTLLLISRDGGFAGPRRAAGWVAAGVVPFLVILLIADYVRWGDPLITGYEKSTAKEWFKISPLDGMPALLFSQSKGVLVYALPILVLSTAGFIVSFSSPRHIIVVIIFLSTLCALLMPASTIEWHGSWAFGPRYALVAYPQMAILAAFAFDRLGGKLRIATLGIVLLGFALVLPGMFTSPFGGVAVAMDASRLKWPDATYPGNYDAGSRDADRFQKLCLLPATEPLNLLRVQHALARAAFAGREGLNYQKDFNLQKEGDALPPPQPEYRKFGSIGFVSHAARFENGAVSLITIFLAQSGVAALIILTIRRYNKKREIACA